MKFRSILLAHALASVTAALPYRGPSGSLLSRNDPDHERHIAARQESGEGSARIEEDESEGSGSTSKPELRILPFGASIMSGVGSSEGSGLRKYLRAALREDGFEVNMVGSKVAGKMTDNNHEAVPGDVIADLAKRVKVAVQYKPNVVIINIGTNDANQVEDVDNAGLRLRKVVEGLWAADDMETSCVFVSTLIPTEHSEGIENRPGINAQYRDLVSELSKSGSGKCIHLADMAPPETGDILRIPEDFADEDILIHPNDVGHEKMAQVFYKAIIAAQGDIKPPEAIDEQPLSLEGGDQQKHCDKEYGSGLDPGGPTQRGSGVDDGIYLHKSVGKDVRLEVKSDSDVNQWRFARLFSQNYDDFVGWYEKDEEKHMFSVWKNSGDGEANFEKIDDLDPNLFCNPAGINFIDMNADGLDDLVCIDKEGVAYLSINQGDGNEKKPPTFKRVSPDAKIKDSEGAPQESVVLADIDGDGRGDYGVVGDDGSVQFWRNGWIEDIPKFWEPLGQRFDAVKVDDASGVRFEDINGDGRDDWLWLAKDSAVTTFTNARSCKQGKRGDGLNVAWRQAFLDGKTEGPTHLGLADFQRSDSDDLRNRTHFARVYGEAQEFGLLGRQDYVFLEHEESDGEHTFKMRVWKNEGQGATKLKADGNKYCNMVGHDDGKADHVWVSSTGEMTLYPNAGKTDMSGGDSFWGDAVKIWTPPAPQKISRRDLHLVDWDGDGICDIVWTDHTDKHHIAGVWINTYKESQRWDRWKALGAPPDADKVQCSFQQGLGVHDNAVQMYDITGNGRGDFLCIERSGRVTAFAHEDDDSWKWLDQVKFSEESDRANMRWGDVNGDGLADLIWVDKFTGDGRVWYNEGPGDKGDNSGSSIHWRKVEEPVFKGNVAGTCVYYPDLDGNKRVDQHSVFDAMENVAFSSFNPSCEAPTASDGDSAGGDVKGDDPEVGGAKDDKDGPDDKADKEPELPKESSTHAIEQLEPTDSTSEKSAVFIDPIVWKDGQVHASSADILVLPPYHLPEPTTITIPPYTTSLQVGESTSTVTITVKPITIQDVPLYNLPVSSGQEGEIQPYPSIDLPYQQVTLGETTRNVTLPPWPYVTMGPPEQWSSEPELPHLGSVTEQPEETDTLSHTGGEFEPTATNEETSTSDIGGLIVPVGTSVSEKPPPVETDIVDPPSTSTVTWSYKSLPDLAVEPELEPDPEPKPKETEEDDEYDDDDPAAIVVFPCKTWFFNLCIDLPKFKVKWWKMRFPKGVVGPGPPPKIDFPPGWTVHGSLPPFPPLTNPPGPGPHTPDIPEPPENCEPKTASVCTTLTEFNVETNGAERKTVTSEVFEKCFDIVGCDAHDWEEESSTTTESCALPTGRKVLPRDAAAEQSITADSVLSSTPRSPAKIPAATASTSSENEEADAGDKLGKRGDDVLGDEDPELWPQDDESEWAYDQELFESCDKKQDYILLPRKFEKLVNVNKRLEKMRSSVKGFEPLHIHSKKGPTAGFTVYWWLPAFPATLAEAMSEMYEVSSIRSWPNTEEFANPYWHYDDDVEDGGIQGEWPQWAASNEQDEDMGDAQKRHIQEMEDDAPEDRAFAPDHDKANSTRLSARFYSLDGNAMYQPTDWGNTMISVYRGHPAWAADPNFVKKEPQTEPFKRTFAYHHWQDPESQYVPGQGQYIYILDTCIEKTHSEFQGMTRNEEMRLPAIPKTDFARSYSVGTHGGPTRDCGHGTMVLSRLVGRSLGTAPGARVIDIDLRMGPSDKEVDPEGKMSKKERFVKRSTIRVRFLEALQLLLDDLHERGDEVRGKAVVNMSFADPRQSTPRAFFRIAAMLMKEISKYDVVMVVASGNHRESSPRPSVSDMHLPAYFKRKEWSYTKNMLIVGAVNSAGNRAPFSESFANERGLYDNIVHAPGVQIAVAALGNKYFLESGTSFAAPHVAGIALYWRSLPGIFQREFRSPAYVYHAMRAFQRTLSTTLFDAPVASSKPINLAGLGSVPVVWNGQVVVNTQTGPVSLSCLMPNNLPPGWCPDIFDAARMAPPPAAPGGGGEVSGGQGGPNDDIWPKRLTLSQGAPSPTCAGDNCGKECQGHYCATRVERPPDFTDPANDSDNDDKSTDQQDCSKCEKSLNETDCEAGGGFQACVWSQCSYDKDCQACGMDCDKASGNVKEPEKKPDQGDDNKNDEKKPDGDDKTQKECNPKKGGFGVFDALNKVSDCFSGDDQPKTDPPKEDKPKEDKPEKPEEKPKDDEKKPHECKPKKGGFGVFDALDQVSDCFTGADEPKDSKPKEEKPKESAPQSDSGGSGKNMSTLWKRLVRLV